VKTLTTAQIARNRIVPIVLAAAVLIGGIAGVAAAAPSWAGNGRQPAAAAVQQRNAAAECAILEATQLTEEQLELSLTGYGAAGAMADEELTIADMLTYSIQDEYLAHGEYAAIIAGYDAARPYTNIMRSEESHIAALSRLYDAYGIAVPADDSAAHLVIPASLLEAAQVGVQAEIDNIAMYDKFLAEELPVEVRTVFEALRDASGSHLAAFERQVDRLTR